MKERLRQRRLQLNLTLQQVASLSKSSKSYIWVLENNDELEPSARKLLNIAMALRTSIDWLLTGVFSVHELCSEYRFEEARKILNESEEDILYELKKEEDYRKSQKEILGL